MADPWVAPDTQAPPDTVPVVPAVAWTAAPPAAPARPIEPTLPAPLRPMTLGDVLDGGLRVWKLAPGTMAALAAVFTVPVQVLLGVLSRDTVDDLSIGQTFADFLSATGPDDVETGFGGDLYALSLVAQGIALALVTGAVARVVTGWYTGQQATFGEVVRWTLRRSPALVAAWFLVHLVEAAFAIALLVPAAVPMTWYAVVSAVITCEGTGPARAMGRSFGLVRSRFWSVLVACLMVALVDVVLSASLTALGALYLEADLPVGWVVNTAVAAGALLVTTPFVAGVVTLLYLDLRIRNEGLDIELRATEVVDR